MGFSKRDSQNCRGFAILSMLFFHMFKDPSRYEGSSISFSPLPEYFVNDIADFLYLCVGIYVFISAYGLTLLYKKWENGDSSFVVYRILKMMMIYFVIYVIVILSSLFIEKDWNIQTAYGGSGALVCLWYMLIDFLGLSYLFGTRTFCGTWWYMSLAIILILLIPVLNRIYDKIHAICMLLIVLLLPKAFGLSVNDFIRFFPILTLGVICARTNLMGIFREQMLAWNKFKKCLFFIGILAAYLLVFFLRENTVTKAPFILLWDCSAPFITICLLYFGIGRCQFISRFLMFFGKYSTIIFLIHTLIRHYWYHSFIYSFGNAYLCYFVLVAVSLGLAIVIDLLLKAIQVSKLENYVCSLLLHQKN